VWNVDIIKTVYYIHGPWRVRSYFAVLYVNYGPYTFL